MLHIPSFLWAYPSMVRKMNRQHGTIEGKINKTIYRLLVKGYQDFIHTFWKGLLGPNNKEKQSIRGQNRCELLQCCLKCITGWDLKKRLRRLRLNITDNIRCELALFVLFVFHSYDELNTYISLCTRSLVLKVRMSTSLNPASHA